MGGNNIEEHRKMPPENKRILRENDDHFFNAFEKGGRDEAFME